MSSTPSSRPSLTLSTSPSVTASVAPSVEESALPTIIASDVPSSHPSERASSSPSLATIERPSISFSETHSAKSEAPSLYPTPSPVTSIPTPSPTLSVDGSIGVIGTVRIGENNGDLVISSIENGMNSGEGNVPNESSKATSILATLFALTMIGGMVYLLSKKYPEKFNTLGVFNRLGTILRIARGDDLVDIVSEASASTNSRKSALAPARHEEEVQNPTVEANGPKSRPNKHSGLDSSARAAVTFAEDLVTMIPIRPSTPMKRSVSFAEELTTELGPSARIQSNSLDEIDDYLVGSSSRSTNSGEEFTDSSGTFDSTDEPMEYYDSWTDRSARVAFRAQLGNTQIEIPLPAFGISSPTSRSPGDAWADDAV